MGDKPDVEVLVAKKIRKAFPGTLALADVHFELRRGEIHALLGENGAGKSTLVRILGGAITPDSGRLFLEGEEITLHSPSQALSRGIGVVHQELSLLENLSVADNLSLSKPPMKGGWVGRMLGVLDRREMRRRASGLLGIEIDPSLPVHALSPARRQLVEIAKTLMYSPRVLLLDEPTSSLPPDDRRELFERVRILKEHGISIVFITHLLEEARQLSDRITVLRDGMHMGTRRAAATSMSELIALMTGKPVGSVFPTRGTSTGDGSIPRLEIESLASGREVSNVTFSVNPGEIIGLAGLVGSGRTETLKAIFGLRDLNSGKVVIDGAIVDITSPRAALEHGLVYIPEDRQVEGLFSQHSVTKNICVAAANSERGERITRVRGLVLDASRMREVSRALVGRLGIKIDSVDGPVATLSGGNQQKAVLARALAVRPRIVLADEPTRGVAIGSKIEIYRLFRELADDGAAVVLVSSEFEELVGLCDRVVLMHGGQTVEETGAKELDAHELLHLVLASSRAKHGRANAGQGE